MWENWGKPIKLPLYPPSGEMIEAEYTGFFDSLVQSVAISMGILEGNIRLDYKKFGKASI